MKEKEFTQVGARSLREVNRINQRAHGMLAKDSAVSDTNIRVESTETGYVEVMTFAQFYRQFGTAEGKEILAGYHPQILAFKTTEPVGKIKSTGKDSITWGDQDENLEEEETRAIEHIAEEVGKLVEIQKQEQINQDRRTPTRAELEVALKDADREGAPMDMIELAAEFGITREEAEQILEGGI